MARGVAAALARVKNDAMNRLTAKTYPADPAENVTYRYDEPAAGFGVGRLTSVSDTSGSTAYVYDARGNVAQETHVVGAQSYITSYAYDLANHVVQVTYPSGRLVNYTRDAMGRISDVATQANSLATPVTVASGASYAPFGPLTALTYGNGLSLSVTYDEDYQPSARLVAGAASVQDLAYGVDADGNITGITDHLAAARSQIFQYDALDRLTYASGLYGALAYGYDAVGNRTSQSGGTTNLAEAYTYAANSNQLQSVVNGTVTRSLGYSPTGNVASDNRGNGTALSFAYDLSDRMVQVANQNTPLATYAYNYLGQRRGEDRVIGDHAVRVRRHRSVACREQWRHGRGADGVCVARRYAARAGHRRQPPFHPHRPSRHAAEGDRCAPESCLGHRAPPLRPDRATDLPAALESALPWPIFRQRERPRPELVPRLRPGHRAIHRKRSDRIEGRGQHVCLCPGKPVASYGRHWPANEGRHNSLSVQSNALQCPRVEGL
jgi:YD repeat-containing protein